MWCSNKWLLEKLLVSSAALERELQMKIENFQKFAQKLKSCYWSHMKHMSKQFRVWPFGWQDSRLWNPNEYVLIVLEKGIVNRVAKCQRYGKYICVKILEGWGKKCRRPHRFVKWSSFGVNSTNYYEVSSSNHFDLITFSAFSPRISHSFQNHLI